MGLWITLKTEHDEIEMNTTHNLSEMAQQAGIYEILWNPIDKYTKAFHIIPELRHGYNLLIENPEYFKNFESKNGWGLYDNFVIFVMNVLNACEKYPDADLEVSR